jgi:DNA-binding NarL/FixJ family response regulator
MTRVKNRRTGMSLNLGPIKVLLVDDHEHVLRGLRKLIEGEWPRMVVAGTARTIAQAFENLRDAKPDVVILDLHLRESTAIDFIPAFVRSGAQVLVLTGQNVAAVHAHAISRGARVVVMKHEPAEVLLREIERLHALRDAGVIQ